MQCPVIQVIWDVLMSTIEFIQSFLYYYTIEISRQISLEDKTPEKPGQNLDNPCRTKAIHRI